jgi:hypothetical protein
MLEHVTLSLLAKLQVLPLSYNFESASTYRFEKAGYSWFQAQYFLQELSKVVHLPAVGIRLLQHAQRQ